MPPFIPSGACFRPSPSYEGNPVSGPQQFKSKSVYLFWYLTHFVLCCFSVSLVLLSKTTTEQVLWHKCLFYPTTLIFPVLCLCRHQQLRWAKAQNTQTVFMLTWISQHEKLLEKDQQRWKMQPPLNCSSTGEEKQEPYWM